MQPPNPIIPPNQSSPSQHTLGHVACATCEAMRQAAMHGTGFRALKIEVAGKLWLESRARLSPASILDYAKCLKPLGRFFGMLTLEEIHIGHVHEYQKERARTVGPVRINRECIVLGQIMKRAGLWDEIVKFYEPMALPKRSRGIALEPEEEEHLFMVAARHAKWFVAYCAGVLARNTCMGTGEVKNLQLANLDTNECLWVRVEVRVKNDFRIRTLRCNPDASWALLQLLARARKNGACLPEHYLIPHRADKGNAGADPTRPCYSWYKAWHSLCEEAGKKYPRLSKLRFYDMRHTANTRMLENPAVPYNVIEHYMGHQVNSQTKRLYDHLRDQAIQHGADALSSGHVERIRKPVNLAFVAAKKRVV